VDSLRASLLRLAVNLRLVRTEHVASLRRRIEAEGIGSSFVVCSTPRTGSTMLADALESTGLVGRPREWLGVRFTSEVLPAIGRRGFPDYVVECARSAADSGVFGLKLHWYQGELLLHLLRLMRGTRALSDREVLEASLPDPRFVWLRREDEVAQAVSWWKATATGAWLHSGSATSEPAFDFAAIDARVRQVRRQTEAWKGWFEANGLAPLRITYEQLVHDPAATTRGVLAFLDVEVPAGLEIAPRTRRQGGAVNEEWARRYRERASGRATLAG
jgi:LPS sulfotransferase NodH